MTRLQVFISTKHTATDPTEQIVQQAAVVLKPVDSADSLAMTNLILLPHHIFPTAYKTLPVTSIRSQP